MTYLQLRTFIICKSRTDFKQNWKDMKIYKIVSVKEKACDDKLNEMAQYYGKEINDLRNKLNDANLTIEQKN